MHLKWLNKENENIDRVVAAFYVQMTSDNWRKSIIESVELMEILCK